MSLIELRIGSSDAKKETQAAPPSEARRLIYKGAAIFAAFMAFVFAVLWVACAYMSNQHAYAAMGGFLVCAPLIAIALVVTYVLWKSSKEPPAHTPTVMEAAAGAIANIVNAPTAQTPMTRIRCPNCGNLVDTMR